MDVRSLPTYFGPLNYRLRRNGGTVLAEFSGEVTVPDGKIILRSPRNADVKSVNVDGVVYKNFTAQEVVLEALPAKVELAY